MKKTGKIFLIAIASILLATNALAAEFIAPSKDDKSGSVTLSAGETHHNLYLVGANVTINSNITGDLFVAGGTINITGNVQDDLFVAGGSVNLNGTMGGDLRVAGGNLAINSPVKGDILVGGGNLILSEKASVGGDLVVGGGNVIIDSPVVGNILLGGGNATINSKVTGNITARVDQKLEFGPKSDVAGKVVYRSKKEAVIKPGAKVPNIEFNMLKQEKRAAVKGLFTVAMLVSLLAAIIAAWLLNRFFKERVRNIVTQASSRPWANFGIGFLGLVVVPIAAIVLFITVVGYYTALILLAWFGLAILIGCVLAAVVLGSWIMRRINKTPEIVIDWKTIVLGVLVYKIISWIPIVGWLAAAIIFLITFGAMLKVIKRDITTA